MWDVYESIPRMSYNFHPVLHHVELRTGVYIVLIDHWSGERTLDAISFVCLGRVISAPLQDPLIYSCLLFMHSLVHSLIEY